MALTKPSAQLELVLRDGREPHAPVHGCHVLLLSLEPSQEGRLLDPGPLHSRGSRVRMHFLESRTGSWESSFAWGQTRAKWRTAVLWEVARGEPAPGRVEPLTRKGSCCSGSETGAPPPSNLCIPAGTDLAIRWT